MLRFENKPHNGGAKDGEFEMSLGMSAAVVAVERMVGGGEIIEAFADRATSEQDYHDVKRSLGFGATTGPQHLAQLGRVQFESVDAHARRIMGLGQESRRTLRSQRKAEEPAAAGSTWPMISQPPDDHRSTVSQIGAEGLDAGALVQLRHFITSRLLARPNRR